MNRKDILKMCIQNLKRRRSRTLLTLLGVLIGCCSIVIMVSIGIGMAESQNRMLAEMGDLTIITVTPKQNGKGKIKLNDSALGQIRHMEHVAAVTPKLNLEEYECTIRLYAGANDRYVAEWSTVAGIDTRELDRMGYKLISGQNARQSGDVLTGSTWPTILPTPSVPRAAIPWTAGAAGSARTAIRFRYRTPTLTQPPPPSPWKSR